jgi:glycosyltransferase involved in cell wall biosynthesis
MFPLKIKNSSHSPRDITPFVFIGRISIQKNLHTLLKCYLQAHSQNPQLSPLYLYGSQDHLGYPNLGIKNSTYLNDLIKLVPSNVLNHKIFFKGFVEREVIQKEIGSQHIFISTSLHSDENFGMAALRSLYIGAKAILTDWGGHQNFIKYYPQSIQYIDVKFNNGVLAIDEEQLIQSFTNTSLLPHLIQTKENGRFEAMNIATQIQDKITEFNHIAAEEISPTILAEKLYEQQALFEKNGELQRCFRDFADPIYHEYISQYL